MKNNLFFEAEKMRKNLIDEFPLNIHDLQYPLSVAYIWPTKYCPLGCAHCMYASPKLQEIDKKMILSRKAIDNFINITKKGKLDSLVISGGGEPMLEWKTVQKLVRDATYDFCEVITSGYFLVNDDLTKKYLSGLQKVLSYRKKKKKSHNFCLRISIDEYHQKVVKLEWIKKLIYLLKEDARLPHSKRSYPDIKLYFRALLIEDKTVEELAKLTRAHLTSMENYERQLIIEDKKSPLFLLSVMYKDMRFVGRGKNAKVKTLIGFDQYFESHTKKENDVQLGMGGSYVKHGLKHKLIKGIDVFVTHEGDMLPYGGVGDIDFNLYKSKNYKLLLAKLFRDIISRTLLLKGLHHIEEIDKEVDPHVLERVRNKNWLASVADESLATAAQRLYVTIRLFQKHIKSGELKKENLSPYAQKIISISKNRLQREFADYMHHAKHVIFSYANERNEMIAD